MNQFDDGRSERREESVESKPCQAPIGGKSEPLSEHFISPSEMSSALLCARYIVTTVIEDSVDQLNEMRSRLNEPFLFEGASIEERSIVLEGVSEALWAMVDQDGTDRQLSRVFDIAKDSITFFGADDPELVNSHTVMAKTIIRLLGVRSEDSQVTNFVENSDLRATLYLVAERLLRIESVSSSEYRQDLERIIVSDLVTLSDQLVRIESPEDIPPSDMSLLNSLVSCCQTTESSFFDESLTTLFHTLSDILDLVDEDEDEDDMGVESEPSAATILAHAATATMKAMTVCQEGKKQEPLWREIIDQSDSSDSFWSIALIGMSKIDPSFVYPYIRQLLIESAQHERVQMPRPISDHPKDEDFMDESSISDQFISLLDLLGGNENLFPALEEAMESLKKHEQRAIARVCRQAQECDEIDFSTESVLSDGLFEERIVQILTKSTTR